jgi:6-phosphogluconolactonase (cycloisomerase 2 family)
MSQKLFIVLFLFSYFSNVFCQSASSFDKVFTAGYSDLISTYSLLNGTLSLTQELKLESNMTFVQVVDDKSILYSVHEVGSYGNFGKSGAVSRWKIGQNSKGLPTFTKLQVLNIELISF